MKVVLQQKCDANTVLPLYNKLLCRYTAALIKRHGDDYTAMARDMKLNDMQWPVDRCARLCEKFKSLADEFRLVPVPQHVPRIRHAPL